MTVCRSLRGDHISQAVLPISYYGYSTVYIPLDSVCHESRLTSHDDVLRLATVLYEYEYEYTLPGHGRSR